MCYSSLKHELELTYDISPPTHFYRLYWDLVVSEINAVVGFSLLTAGSKNTEYSFSSDIPLLSLALLTTVCCRVRHRAGILGSTLDVAIEQFRIALELAR